jgi:hypothetical protein
MVKENKLDFAFTWKVSKYKPEFNELVIDLAFSQPDHISLRHPDYL